MSVSHALCSAVRALGDRWPTTPNGTARHPISITSASVSFEAEYRVRVRRLAIVGALRVIVFVVAGVVYAVLGTAWAAIAILAVAIPMPWIVALVVDDLPPWANDDTHR